ncbi:hemin uptake protein HemP [Mesorhizobium sp. L48C026A00]|uniref:hemin uptake protein HemP n=1 Tax=Mesorhizobium sp. L48C026A00 TaxID=1287182 RepID=UPI001FDA7068|nr:hemin uptake protein HemP [Mesorhizobium sp. L48C026A00]
MCLSCHSGLAAQTAPPGFGRVSDDVRTLASDTLFLVEHQIGIEDYGAPYRLKIPRQGS